MEARGCSGVVVLTAGTTALEATINVVDAFGIGSAAADVRMTDLHWR